LWVAPPPPLRPEHVSCSPKISPTVNSRGMNNEKVFLWQRILNLHYPPLLYRCGDTVHWSLLPRPALTHDYIRSPPGLADLFFRLMRFPVHAGPLRFFRFSSPPENSPKGLPVFFWLPQCGDHCLSAWAGSLYPDDLHSVSQRQERTGVACYPSPKTFPASPFLARPINNGLGCCFLPNVIFLA